MATNIFQYPLVSAIAMDLTEDRTNRLGNPWFMDSVLDHEYFMSQEEIE